MALQLAGDIAKYVPDVHPFVLDDHPELLQGMGDLVVLAHTRHGAKDYKDKLGVVAKALGEFEIYIFLDADVRSLQPVRLDASVLGLGLHACRLLTRAGVRERHSASEPAHWKREFPSMMLMLWRELKLQAPDGQVPQLQEHPFAISRGAPTTGLLRKWNEVAGLREMTLLKGRIRRLDLLG